jgi:hypothetical protein
MYSKPFSGIILFVVLVLVVYGVLICVDWIADSQVDGWEWDVNLNLVIEL